MECISACPQQHWMCYQDKSIPIHTFTCASFHLHFGKKSQWNNWVKSPNYRLATSWKSGRVDPETKKKGGITGCSAPQWASRLAVFQFVKYISEIAHFLSPVGFWEITRWWPALFGFVNRLMQAASVDTGFVSHETSPTTDFQGRHSRRWIRVFAWSGSYDWRGAESPHLQFQRAGIGGSGQTDSQFLPDQRLIH